MSTHRDNRNNSNVNWEPWITTISGKRFFFLDGKADDVILEDMAIALSRSPRWAGHTKKFFSVAQHSVLTAELVKEKGGTNLEQRKALFHDGTEAYMTDIPSPLKKMIPRFKEIENEVWIKIARKFFGRKILIGKLVKQCDTIMLSTEARDLFSFPPLGGWVEHCPPPWEHRIKPVGHVAAYNLFINKYKELTSGL